MDNQPLAAGLARGDHPTNWRNRCRFFGDFGGLRVFLVDVYDIFVSRLSSKKLKHRQDLEVLAANLDKETIRRRLLEDGKAFLGDPFLQPQIQENWRFIFREPLPLEKSKPESPQLPSESGQPPTKKKGGKKRKGQ